MRMKVLQTNEHYIPEWPYLQDFERCDKELKNRQKKDFDRHNQVHSLPDISDNTDVWVMMANRPTQGHGTSLSCDPIAKYIHVSWQLFFA